MASAVLPPLRLRVVMDEPKATEAPTPEFSVTGACLDHVHMTHSGVKKDHCICKHFQTGAVSQILGVDTSVLYTPVKGCNSFSEEALGQAGTP